MRIALDGMGGDRAPTEIVAGAVRARELGVKILLVGPEEKLRRELSVYGASRTRHIEIVPAEQVVQMAEAPLRALREKPDATIFRVVRLVAEGEAEAAISAGNSGALFAGSLRYLRLRGMSLPCFGALIPAPKKPVLLVDAGANADCQPRHLLEFAIMGHAYVQEMHGIGRPRVGLVNIGAEEEKGNRLARQAHGLLRNSQLNFVGNAEGREFFSGRFDVLVTDGFTGNVILKTSEGAALIIRRIIQQELTAHPLNRIPLFFLLPSFRRLARRLDYHSYGGAPILGLRKVVVVAHGSANARAILATIRQACRMVERRLPERIAEAASTLRRR